MVDGKRVAVVVPAHDEERLIGTTLAGIPEFVDRILVVDDASTDGTADAVRALADPRVELVAREQNGGVGAAIVTGYERALEDGLDVVCVMAADNQMDPADLLTLVEPVARGDVDYAKANRLVSGEAWKLIPRTRYLGNAILSLLTKVASGYWHVADSQTGYTAISRGMLAQLDLDNGLSRLRLPERHARAPQRLECACPRLPVPPRVRRRRAVGDQAAQGRPAHLLAAAEGVLLAAAREVRDPRLPPARLLLRARDPDDPRRARCSASSR